MSKKLDGCVEESRMKNMKKMLWLFIPAACLIVPALTIAQTSNQELAKKLSNPVAALISAPFQFNYDQNIGPQDDGSRLTLNIQPVIPFSISKDWNLISRTISPVVSQHDIFPDAGSQFGIGDIVQSFFFSPKRPTSGGLIWGAGPVILLPTASDDLLGTKKWGIGPTGVVLKQDGPWTYGALANHIWSVGGDSDRQDISNTFLQPFLSFTNKAAWSFTVNSESTYNWKSKKWAIPLNGVVSKVTRIGNQMISFAGGIRCWAKSQVTGPKKLGFRFVVTLLFPKG
jgi:hypothetical protein